MRAATAVAYAALALFWIYVVSERQLWFGSDSAALAFLVIGSLVHFAIGFVIGRWWAAVLPVLAVIAAVPAGYPDANKGEPFEIWVGLAWFVAPIGAALIVIGVLVRRWPDRPAAQG